MSATRANAVKTPRNCNCTLATLRSLFDVATTESNPWMADSDEKSDSASESEAGKPVAHEILSEYRRRETPFSGG